MEQPTRTTSPQAVRYSRSVCSTTAHVVNFPLGPADLPRCDRMRNRLPRMMVSGNGGLPSIA